MVGFTSIAVAATALLGVTTAAPANQIRSTGVIHRITAGSTTANNGLSFEVRRLPHTRSEAQLTLFPARERSR